MKRNNIILITIAIITLLALVIGATYAYFATGNLNITNVVNANTVTEQNNMIFDTLGGGMILNITAANMVEAKQGNVAVENNTTLTVNFTANTDYSMVCTYDIVYEWTSSDKYLAHTSGVTANEFTVQGTLASNAHVSEGTNSISSETDLSTLTYTNYAATVVSGAQIDGIGSITSTAVWTLSSKFYNVGADQSSLSGKTYAGKFRVANVSCVAGTASGGSSTAPSVTVPVLSAYWFDRYNCGQNDSMCAYGDYEPSLQTSGLDTGYSVYVGQDDSKYYACGNDGNGHEACLSLPYTQYGLEGHTPGSPFTTEQSTSALNYLIAFFNASGVDFDENDCVYDSASMYCFFSNYVSCGVFDQGVDCVDNIEQITVRVTPEGAITSTA